MTLSADEMAVLRECVRALVRAADELAMAEDVQRFYGGQLPPLPDGVVPATQEELAAADAEQW
jgi:hypothetical protein